jgi:hypothetical protein
VSKSQREGANDERIASRTGEDVFEQKFLFFLARDLTFFFKG